MGSLLQDSTKYEQSENSLNGNMYDFTVDLGSIEKEDILNIHQYWRIKNNIK